LVIQFISGHEVETWCRSTDSERTTASTALAIDPGRHHLCIMLICLRVGDPEPTTESRECRNRSHASACR
jgi:hypothetical protein